MLYLANASSPRVRDAMAVGIIGMLATPAEGRSPKDVAWGADNGCFGKGYPGDDRWLAWLLRHQRHAARCLFAAAPDVVGDAAATLTRSTPLLPLIRQLGYPAALVAQNGLTPAMVQWEAIDALFLGGSAECLPCGYIKPIDDSDGTTCPSCHRRLTEWKLSAAARALTTEAKRRNLHVHMGRVNSGRRIVYAALTGCDTSDGTFLARAPDKNLIRMARWQAALDQARWQTAIDPFTKEAS